MKKIYQSESYYVCCYIEGERVRFLLTHNPKLTLFYLNDIMGLQEIKYIEPRLRLGEAFWILEKIINRFARASKENNRNLWSGIYSNICLCFRKKIHKFSTNIKQSKNNSPNIKLRNSKSLEAISTRLEAIATKLEAITTHALRELSEKIGFQYNEVKVKHLRITEINEEFVYHKPTDKDVKSLICILEGRNLYQSEILQGISETGANINGSLIDILHWLQLKNLLELKPSIVYTEKFNFQCQRCGQTDEIHSMECFDCGSVCNYCENCVSMGEARTCRPLYSWKELNAVNKPNNNNGNETKTKTKTKTKTENIGATIDIFGADEQIVLTKAQQDAYEKLSKFVESKFARALIIAVCGAGKTEIVFGAILKALTNGQKVLFAIPRKDVVLELYPRLNKYFAQYNVLPLYGGCPQKYTPSRLVIATTHQTLRFKEAFDLVILDEVDAFPYKDSEMLYYAVERAKKKGGKIIYMTATPDKQLLSRSKEKGWQRITISARYHGHPLPVPEIIIENDNARKNNLYSKNSNLSEDAISTTVWEIIKRSVLDDMVQLFIFVPSIDIAEKVGKLIAEQIEKKGIGPREWVQYSHSKDSQREIKRQGFSRGDFPIFISTTIMERGITVPKANVVVFFSHWEKIFDQGTLIQMAGRAGRSKEYPEGKVFFVGEKVTDAMVEAKKIIVSLNKQAVKMGYIKMEEK